MNQPRLKLYSKPKYYIWALKQLLGISGSREEAENCYTKMLRDFLDVKHVIAMPLGRMAMYEGLRALYPQGGEIIVTPLTVPEVSQLIVLAGLSPVFCDIKKGTWNLDCEKVEELISNKTRAIVSTHLYGNTNTTLPIKNLCDAHGLDFIEDAAQSLGGYISDKRSGSLGRFSLISHSYAKNVPSFYGGALVTNDDNLSDKIYRNISSYSEVDRAWLARKVFKTAQLDIGTNQIVFSLATQPLLKLAYRYTIKLIRNKVEIHLNDEKLDSVPRQYLTKLSAAQYNMLCDKIPEIDSDITHRIECAKLYHEGLSGVKNIVVPPLVTDRSHTYLYFPVEVPDREQFIRYMVNSNCDISIHHLADNASLESMARHRKVCPNAKQASENTVMLPTYPDYEFDSVRRTVKHTKQYYGS